MAELTKIRATHLQRQAWVYVRQSTMTQVRENTESLNRQYELAQRAQHLGGQLTGYGWSMTTWVVRARMRTHATGFRNGRRGRVGQVGLVLGIEVSRLARCNADWYHLLDLCAMTDTLIADADGMYHPGDYNDRLVLGLKGTMSEAELHVLRSRLNAGCGTRPRGASCANCCRWGWTMTRTTGWCSAGMRRSAPRSRRCSTGSTSWVRRVRWCCRCVRMACGCRAGPPARGSSAGPRRPTRRSTIF
ncbi:resolvase, N terminal domain protein [Mycobacterium kansasii 732]|nr:resolvase, N terminal domain protein [Mycobacterium kansasii 732]